MSVPYLGACTYRKDTKGGVFLVGGGANVVGVKVACYDLVHFKAAFVTKNVAVFVYVGSGFKFAIAAAGVSVPVVIVVVGVFSCHGMLVLDVCAARITGFVNVLVKVGGLILYHGAAANCFVPVILAVASPVFAE